MFDIGFPELLLISIVALLVIGPDQLPQAIRTLSLWIGRIRRSFARVREEIEKEIGADEIRAQLHNEEILQEIEQSKAVLDEATHDVNKIIDTTINMNSAERNAVDGEPDGPTTQQPDPNRGQIGKDGSE